MMSDPKIQDRCAELEKQLNTTTPQAQFFIKWLNQIEERLAALEATKEGK